MTGCWHWSGAWNDGGYGNLTWRGRDYRAHRLVYTLLVGPIPKGLELDHLCRVPCCVNPAHLEPVTHHENRRRGALARIATCSDLTCCPYGHPWTPENTIIVPNESPVCRECHRLDCAKLNAKNGKRYKATHIAKYGRAHLAQQQAELRAKKKAQRTT
jgi:hypothetical protein